MMQSAGPPSPNDGIMPETEEFDDPFPSSSSLDVLDDLALGGGDANGSGETDVAVFGDPRERDVGADAAGEEAVDVDPWAVLAAAAGEGTPAPVDVVPPTPAPVEILSHAAGETFAAPVADGVGSQPSLAAQIQSSTANLSTALTSKIAEVDAAHGISTKARGVDEQYHLTEKWSNFQSDVLKPTTARTVERTKEVTREVSKNVSERVGPAARERWGSIRERSAEIGIAKKWGSLSSAVGSRWNETREQVGESVGHWKEEQEKKKAMANATGGNATADQLQLDVEGAKEKVVESWTGGVNWVSQRIRDAKIGGEAPAPPRGPSDRELQTLDSDGLPSSFHRKG